jgi:ORF6N domain
MVHWIRHEKVILDFDLAELYQVETRALKQSVRRNRDRFPDDFLFELSSVERDALGSQSVIPSRKKFGGAAPLGVHRTGYRHAFQRSALPARPTSRANSKGL